MVAGCGPVPWSLVVLYRDNPFFALLVDTLAALGLLALAGLLLRPLRGRLGAGMLWGLRLGLASLLVLVHEYLKEGYWFDPRDLHVFPPRSHESFLAYLLALGTILARLGLPLP